ncbi:hypothetical protein [Undibacterium sp. TJN19]|uniref:hypothetical protein n=1 Tax=Undibacterium sp. TJN19 TaxID=3413055 RepID=UPI003BF449EF
MQLTTATTIASLNSAAFSLSGPGLQTSRNSSTQNVAATATTVTAAASSAYSLNLQASNVNQVPLTYDKSGLQPFNPVQVWSNNENDELSQLLGQRNSLDGAASRFKGLGAALIARYQATPEPYQQAVSSYVGAVSASSAVAKPEELAKASFDKLEYHPDQSVNLSVKLHSGSTINFSIKSNANGISVEASGSAELGELEKKALDTIAGGLESAVAAFFNGGHVNLDAISKFDTNVVSSVALDIQSADSQLKFQIDQTQHQLKINTTAGAIDITVARDNTVLPGSTSQRNQAIQHYLAQIDSASSRGHADDKLISLYKEAFTGMHKINTQNADDNAINLNTAPVDRPVFWDQSIQPLLTGLADFDAKITGVEDASNPARLQETDFFNYQTSQKTQTTGGGLSGKVSQVLDSRLSAAFHEELKTGKKPLLTESASSQNYRYTTIDDHVTSKLVLGFEKGQLASAHLEKTAKQLTSVSTYELGVLRAKQNYPNSQHQVDDFRVTADRGDNTNTEALQRTRIIAQLSGKIFADFDG